MFDNWKVSWMVFVDGINVSLAMRPYLISIAVTDKDGAASDTCSLVFDDTDGQCLLPRDGASIIVFLQGVKVFEGTADVPRSSGSRSGGRKLSVSAKGFDSRGKVKEAQSFHKDDCTLKVFLEKAAKNAGFTIKIDPDLAKIKRDYWAADGESFLHLGQKIARELNATFKIRGKKAVLIPRGKDMGLPPVTAAYGVNLISWDIAPFTGRKAFTKTEVKYFDRKEAKFKTEKTDHKTSRKLPDSTNKVRSTAANKDQAKGIGKARKGEAEREGGEGRATIDLNVAAQAEGLCMVIGARPGVDGAYRMASVTHKATRSGGSTTSLSLKQPSGGAGKDNRAKK